MIKVVKIPEKRIGVLIGKRGKVKKEIEELTNTKIDIDKDVRIEGDALDVINAENVIKAIGRGFSPEKAFELLDEENTLVIIELPKNEKAIKRISSRIIGSKGRCRKKIETITKTYISVYGKTVSIIGRYDNVDIARIAIEKLISGSGHKNVYDFLERRKK